MTRPSITSWRRLEPRPRSDSIVRALAAEVRDPLWFLTRQWQFGEFQGEDAASPAWVRFEAGFARVDHWGPAAADLQPFDKDKVPLEELSQTEPFTPDLTVQVELGQRFEAMLADGFSEEFGTPLSQQRAAELATLIEEFRTTHALESLPDESVDHQSGWFLRVCAGRATNGVSLLDSPSTEDLPAEPAIADPTHQAIVRAAVSRWRIWIGDVYGEPGTGDAPAWLPDQLEYGVAVSARVPAGGHAEFAAHPGREGEFDWYAFDERAFDATAGSASESFYRSLLPMQVRFRGMPHNRWWQFQDRIADLGEIQPEMREIAKLVLMDFMFVHGNDWFVVPFSQDVGTLCQVHSLVVTDVFGGTTNIERADRHVPEAPAAGIEAASRRWSLFSITAPEREGGLADYFILPPTAGTLDLTGETLESTKFVRDEMANMVWAIEHTTENALGQPWSGHERAQAELSQDVAPAIPGNPDVPLRYQIQNTVPRNWIPFVPVQIDLTGEVDLVMSAMLTPDADGSSSYQTLTPHGRILNPGDAPYRIREEEVPRTGTTISRLVRRSRWVDGSTHLWISRRKRPGSGEGSSGLQFDGLKDARSGADDS